jgi:MFS family permease
MKRTSSRSSGQGSDLFAHENTSMKKESSTSDYRNVSGSKDRLGWLYAKISGEEEKRICKDISETACRALPHNFFVYLTSNVLTKIADELSSAKLILPWLLGALGAPAVFSGFLVPIRESGVLIPQLLVAAYTRRLAIRKVVWLTGAALTSLSLILMALSASSLRGVQAGWAIIALLSIFSLARGLCSVSSKDVLGKTISKTRRGTLMGYSTGISGFLTLFIGLYINFYTERFQVPALFAFFLVSSAAMWMLAFAFFSTIKEEPSEIDTGGNTFAAITSSFSLVLQDSEFRKFITARALLLSVALAPPFYVLLAQQSSKSASGLGLLIVASGLAGSLSAPFWGKMSDHSSREVMLRAAIGAGLTGVTISIFDFMGFALLDSIWSHVIFFFLIALFHSGVRLGRKVYLIDMSNETNRSQYVAVSNTLIGLIMLLCGGVGVVGDILQTGAVVGLLGVFSLLAAFYVGGIEDVSG